MPFHLNSGREAHDSQHHKAVRRRCRRECRSLMAAYRRVCRSWRSVTGRRSATDTHRIPTEWTSPSGRRWRQRPGGTSTVDCVVVLLSESASLTARETLTVLGMRGVRADVLATHALTIGRFSRWRRWSIPAPPPSRDPLGYLAVVRRLMTSGEYEAVLATHEHAWLFAAGRLLLPQDAPIAVASIEAFDRVAGKVDFATLLDELHVPQPEWWLAGDRPSTVPYPHWVKASHGTAGRCVRRVANARQECEAIRELSSPHDSVMGQVPAPGQYGQVQALFDHGRLIAVHTSVQVGYGAGGSAAARLSVNHPEAREHAARIGKHLTRSYGRFEG
jgi:hypothetical protein